MTLKVLVFKTKPFVDSCQKGPIATSSAVAINSPPTKEFEMSPPPFLTFTLKTDHFQSAPFSNLCVFISVFEKLRQKRISIAPFSYDNEAV